MFSNAQHDEHAMKQVSLDTSAILSRYHQLWAKSPLSKEEIVELKGLYELIRETIS